MAIFISICSMVLEVKNELTDTQRDAQTHRQTYVDSLSA